MGLGRTEYTEEESDWTLSFYEDGRVASFGWDEEGSHLQYDTTYTIEFRPGSRQDAVILNIPGQFRYIVSIISEDHLSLGQDMADGLGFGFRRLSGEE